MILFSPQRQERVQEKMGKLILFFKIKKLNSIFLFCILCASVVNCIEAKEYIARFEGVLGEPKTTFKNFIKNVDYFLPYNPIIVEAGAYTGQHTKKLAKLYPKGRIFAFEPCEKAFRGLLLNCAELKNVQVFNMALYSQKGRFKLYIDDVDEQNNTLLENPENQGFSFFHIPSTEISTTTLDEWCQEHQIDHVDFLQLDVSGSEWQVIEGAKNILKETIVIHTTTQFRKENTTMTFYNLKKQLNKLGFEMLSHWFYQGEYGEATFIRKEIYDALFK